MSEINFNGWVRTIDRLPSIEDADDAGHVYQCEKTNDGFRFLNDCHIALLRMDKDRNCLNGREYWHSKPKAPKLPEEKEPAMSEFKVGDKIVYHSLPHQRLFYVKASLSDSIVVRECLDEAGAKCFSEFPPYTDIRHATPQEIAVGHRIDKPSDSRELEILDKPVGSLQELHPEFAKVLHENFLELLGDDAHIENHISPLCKSKDVEKDKPMTFNEWLGTRGDMVLLHANCCRIAYEGGQQSMQAKVEELQKQVDTLELKIKEIASIAMRARRGEYQTESGRNAGLNIAAQIEQALKGEG